MLPQMKLSMNGMEPLIAAAELYRPVTTRWTGV